MTDAFNFLAGDDEFEMVASFSRHYGFGSFVVFPLEAAGTMSSEKLLVTNFADETVSFMDRTRWWDRHRLLFECFRNNRPQVFDIKKLAANPEPEEVTQLHHLMEFYSVRKGLVFPVYRGNVLGFFGLLAEDVDLSDGQLSAMHVGALAIFERLVASRKQYPLPRLTSREIECLSWTSLGKTSGEIAVILAVSEHAVVRHLTSAARKLSALNRGNAVAKAIRLGLMH